MHLVGSRYADISRCTVNKTLSFLYRVHKIQIPTPPETFCNTLSTNKSLHVDHQSQLSQQVCSYPVYPEFNSFMCQLRMRHNIMTGTNKEGVISCKQNECCRVCRSLHQSHINAKIVIEMNILHFAHNLVEWFKNMATYILIIVQRGATKSSLFVIL